ncbi:MAG TPA: MFS transporter [Rhizomicrobium sp.]|nr:MFS transporter [Rhizomicrobium sp.]
MFGRGARDIEPVRNRLAAAFAACLGMGTGVGLFVASITFFIKPLGAEFGWSRSEIGAAAAVGFASALTAPIIGLMVDRYGARRMALGGVAVMLLGYVALVTMTDWIWNFYLITLFLSIAGPMVGAMTFTKVVVGWFERHRGLMIGVTMSGVSLITIFTAPALQYIIAQWGWRMGYVFLAGVTLCVGLPILLAFLHEKRLPVVVLKADPVAGVTVDLPSVWPVLRDRRLWLLILSAFAANVPIGGLALQLQPLLTDKGIDGQSAALLASVFGISVVVSRLAAGMLLDRFWAPGVAFATLALPAMGVLLLLGPEPNLVFTIVGVVMLGIAQGAEGDQVAFFVAKLFDLRIYSRIFSILMMCISASLGVGGILFGYAFDKTGSYDIVLYASSASFIFAGVCMLLIGRVPRRVEAPAVA